MKCKYLEHQICIRNDGQYRLCCASMENDNTESIYTHTPIEWHNSNFHKTTRKLLSEGTWPESCSPCKDQENKGIQSQRQKPRQYGPGLSHFDLRFGNSCNLKCISCWGMSSSSIAEEAAEMLSAGVDSVHTVFDITNFNWVTEENLQRLYTSGMKEVYLTGGEPMMMKYLPEFLDRLDKNISLRFNTNCTIWNPKIEKLLRKFDNVLMALSLDATDQRINYIRYGSDWSQVHKNAQRYADFCHININPTISVLNSTFIDDIKEYADKYNFDYHENLLMNPPWLHCKNAPDSLKEKYKKQSVIDWGAGDADLLSIEVFKDKIVKLDKWRNIRIRDYLPEVAEAYGIDQRK